MACGQTIILLAPANIEINYVKAIKHLLFDFLVVGH